MKKIALLLVALCIVLIFAGCGKTEKSGAKPSPSANEASNETVDLTAMSSTMVYSEVYNMNCSPEKYIGKTVRMNGTFSVYKDDITGNMYFACLVADATACCSQGIEFVLKDASYPEDYPQENEIFTVEGIFNTYKEGENTYCQLKDATLVK